MLQSIFTELLQQYTNDAHYIEVLWHELLKKYSGKKRYYHNLLHLENMYEELTFSKPHIQDWSTVLFSLFYHDIIYNPLRQDNEERSAALAFKRLQPIVPAAQLQKCCDQIQATKNHEWSNDGDANLFTDADLSILGQDRNMYETYAKAVRKEYSIYPDFIYNNGRKKALEHFLQMNRIFKTEIFFERYEATARANIAAEIKSLGA